MKARSLLEPHYHSTIARIEDLDPRPARIDRCHYIGDVRRRHAEVGAWRDGRGKSLTQ